MPRKPNATLPTSLHEPVFQEGVPTPNPTQFKTPVTDDSLYTPELQKLLVKDVVAFNQSSGKPGDLFPLATAWGAHGAEVIQSIQAAKAINFHMIGDSVVSKQSSFPAMIKVSEAATKNDRPFG